MSQVFKTCCFLLLSHSSIWGQISVNHISRATALGSSTASGNGSTAMGSAIASGPFSTAMGAFAEASGLRSTAMGDAQASGSLSVAMGTAFASGSNSTAMGRFSVASGDYSTAAGFLAIASGNHSVAIGHDVDTNNKIGAMILGDSNPEDADPANVGANDQMVTRFANGYFFITGVGTGMFAGAGANAWSAICDKDKKENFQLLDDRKVLGKLASIDYTSWNYQGQDPTSFRHYGIMAQDFYKLFGEDDFGKIGVDTLVNPIDMLGISMSALKGAKLEIEQLKAKNIELENRLSAIENQLSISANNSRR